MHAEIVTTYTCVSHIVVPLPSSQTICYSRLPSSKNEDGLVGLQFKKPHTELMSQDSLEQSLQSVAAHNAAVQVVIDSIKPKPDNWSVKL